MYNIRPQRFEEFWREISVRNLLTQDKAYYIWTETSKIMPEAFSFDAQQSKVKVKRFIQYNFREEFCNIVQGTGDWWIFGNGYIHNKGLDLENYLLHNYKDAMPTLFGQRDYSLEHVGYKNKRRNEFREMVEGIQLQPQEYNIGSTVADFIATKDDTLLGYVSLKLGKKLRCANYGLKKIYNAGDFDKVINMFGLSDYFWKYFGAPDKNAEGLRYTVTEPAVLANYRELIRRGLGYGYKMVAFYDQMFHERNIDAETMLRLSQVDEVIIDYRPKAKNLVITTLGEFQWEVNFRPSHGAYDFPALYLCSKSDLFDLDLCA